MSQWKYVAVGPDGRRYSGEIAAGSAAAAEAALAEKKLYPTSLEPAAEKSGSVATSKTSKKVKGNDVCELLRSIAVMLHAGVPLVEAMVALEENASHAGVQEVVRDMRLEILSGKSLSQAMINRGSVFPQVVCDMVSVSDDSGNMVETLNGAVTYLEKTAAVRKSVIGALIYPGILMSASGIAFLALIVVILPTFNEAFSSMGVKLPWFTTMLMQLGTFIRGNPILIFGGLIGAVVGWKLAMKRPAFQNAVKILLAKLPLIGPIVLTFAMNRALRTMASLLQTKVPIVDAIGYARRVSGHPYFEDAFDKIGTTVGNGATLADSMTGTGRFPKMIVQMVAVGERSGRVSDLIMNTVEHSEADVERRIKSAVGVLEPAVIIIMGLVVGMITVSILMPLFSINNSIK